MSASHDIYDKDIISDSDISDRLDYLAFLDDDDLSEDDRFFWTDEIEELAELKALVAAVGDDTGGLISDRYWDEYAAEDANDKFDLVKTGADSYFNYASYASDLQTDYSIVEFHGMTYYCQ